MQPSTLTGREARAAAERAARRLAADARVRLVYLYSSAADPTRREVHDVDLAVACRPTLAFDDLMRLRADAVAAAGAPLDLIALDGAGVVLAWEVAETGRCLFARDPDDEVAFVPARGRAIGISSRSSRNSGDWPESAWRSVDVVLRPKPSASGC